MESSASDRTASLLESLSRRQWFSRSASGFAGLALGAMLAEDQARGSERIHGSDSSRTIQPRARSVIQLFQHGGPSHIDLLDPKPELNRRDGQPLPASFTDLVKLSAHGNLLGSPFRFRPAGESRSRVLGAAAAHRRMRR